MRTPTRTTRTAAVVAAVAASLALTSCSAGTPAADETGRAPVAESEDMEMTEAAIVPMSTGDPFADARTAAQHMAPTALTLATGLAAATGTEGDVGSAAADLRSELTALLQEHVYLAGTAVATAYATAPDSPEFEAAAATLDANSVDLSEAIGSLAGPEKGAAFLELWRSHVGNFVDYAVAAKGEDQAGKDQALADLQAYTVSAGQFFEEISAGNLPAAAITESLGMHITTLGAAIDALAAGDPTAYAKLQDASEHVAMAAGTIAGGLDTALDLEGDPADAASTLRAGLTQLLQEHVYLASTAVFTAYTDDGATGSPAFAAAAAELDGNSVALSEAVGSLAGPEHGEAFLDLWREHIGYFVDYAVATAGDDTEGAQAALVALDGYRPAAGAFFAEVSAGELPADTVAEGLTHHVETLAGAIDSLKVALVG
ncbi:MULTISPECIES: copper amine oxidase [unclassified Actinotalea]|uniref:copper amine oxidase n=1 Tax=unclassified Actinotalea TaxID=2638618 RepID=UPI0015F77390|nr:MULTISPECIES: copper amine oxidase [unclassified Actinotalea]